MNALRFANICALVAFFSTVTFLLGYSALAPWWRYPVGRAVASLDLALLVALTPSMLRQLFGVNLNHTWFAYYYGASLLLVAGITLWRLLVIWATQRDAGARRGDD